MLVSEGLVATRAGRGTFVAEGPDLLPDAWAILPLDLEKVEELIEARGADLVFLPSYSPDLNPIEEAFSKIKHLVRKVGARTREALVEAMARALAAVTTEDVAGWFAHAGYWPQDQPL
jgi:transposase